MLTFHYKAWNPETQQHVKAIVQADSEQAAASLIRGEGLSPIEITVEKGASDRGIHKLLNRVRTKDRVLFARQLSTLINAGLPLVQALRSVNDQTTSKPLRIIISQVIADVEGGQSLSNSLAKHPETFNQIFLNLVAAGEASGTLDSALDRIATQQEKDADIVSKIRGAMIYPLIVVLVMVAVVVFMLVKVLPQVQILYVSFPGATLPIETRILLDMSHFIIHDYIIVLIALLIIGVGGYRYSKTTQGKRFFDTLKIRTPPMKSIFLKVYMARFARTSSTLIAAGVPLLQVLQITGRSIANVHVMESINTAADKVKGGKSLGGSLEGDQYFLPLVPNMLKIGEQSGSTEAMLAKTADYYEKEVDDTIKNISTIIEPVMMVLLGVIALIIVAAVLLPVYSLAGSGAISGGGV
jgi:type IV pilus assembly protein PilC